MGEWYLFRSDLRLEDNPGLLAHVHANKLLCVYTRSCCGASFSTGGAWKMAPCCFQGPAYSGKTIAHL